MVLGDWTHITKYDIAPSSPNSIKHRNPKIEILCKLATANRLDTTTQIYLQLINYNIHHSLYNYLPAPSLFFPCLIYV